MFDKIQLLNAEFEQDFAVTNCNQSTFEFPGCRRRRVEARFDGGEITSDGGVMLLRQADQGLGLSESVVRALPDGRRRASCEHDLLSLVRQRVYGLALGYEDLNDHATLRDDVALRNQVVAGEGKQSLGEVEALLKLIYFKEREKNDRLSQKLFDDQGEIRPESQWDILSFVHERVFFRNLYP